MFNQVTLVGNVGADPEIRNLDSGAKVANFNIATSERWKDKESGELKEKTEWVRIVLWSGLAEVAEKYVKKGSQLFLQGKLRSRKYTDKDGVDHYITEVFADTLKLLGRKEGNGSNEKFESQAEMISELPERKGEGDDLPF